MKIEPPVGPPPGPRPEELAPGAKKDAPGVSFAEKLAHAAPAPTPTAPPMMAATRASEAAGAAVQGGPPSAAATMSNHLDEIGRELQTGKLQTREQAVGRLVECVLDAKFGGKVPPEALGPMKNVVAAQIAADPHLSERIDGLLKKAQSS